MGILNKIRANRSGYELGRKILSSKIVTESTLYDTLQTKKINKTIQKLSSSPPEGVDIGVTNHCNANCIMCPHSKLKEMGTMNMDNYIKIIDECEEFGVKYVTLSFFGEPLMDKCLIDKIRYAKTNGLKVYFYSNASLMNEDWSKRLIKSGLDGITISFDSNNKETYEKIRRNLKFDVVKGNILRLIKLKQELKSDTPKINLVIVELEENKDEIKDLYKDWKKKVDSINIINMRNWASAINKKGTKESFHYRNDNRVPCALLWTKMVIDWNCDVVLCCDDWAHKVVLGNLKKQSVKDIWNGKKLKKIRECHVNGDFNKLPLCNTCNKKSVWWLVK